jgi:hypothetical protein
MQSDILLLNNQVFSPTQGFTSFNFMAASHLRISIIGNLTAPPTAGEWLIAPPMANCG